MKPTTIFATFLATTGSATKVLLPLYIYPSAGAWDPVYDAIDAHPDVDFQIVINPNSGPDSSCPNSDYMVAIDKLNSYSNVQTIGYVHVGYGARSATEIKAEIDAYADWTDSSCTTTSNVGLHGIFFDETSNVDTSTNKAYMSDLAGHAHSSFSSGHVVFNMGTTPQSTDYYSSADTVIVFESAQSAYQGQTTIDAQVPSGYAARSSILVHSVSSSLATMESQIATIVANGLGSLYFTSDCCWNSVTATPATVGNVAAAVDNA